MMQVKGATGEVAGLDYGCGSRCGAASRECDLTRNRDERILIALPHNPGAMSMPIPDYSWKDKAYFGRVCQACMHEIKCQPPKDYDKGASYTTQAYQDRVCPKCKSEAFDFGSYRHAESCQCWYCTEDIED